MAEPYFIFRELVAFINGRAGPVASVARLSPEIRDAIGASVDLVHAQLPYARKLRGKHGLRPEHFNMIDIVANYGWAGIPYERNVVFFYEDRQIFQTWFKLAVKTAADGSEVWLKTFHKAAVEDFQSAARRWRCIRPHR